MLGRTTTGEPYVLTAYLAIAAAGAVAIALEVLAAPAIGDLIAPEPLDVWASVRDSGLVRPEPVEFVRFAIAAAVPVIVAAVVLARGSRPLPASLIARSRWLTPALTAIAAVALVVAWVTRSEPDALPTDPQNYFGALDGLMALVIAAAIVALASSQRARERAAGWAGSRRLAVAATVVAIAGTVVFLLPAALTDRSLLGAQIFVTAHLPYYLSDYTAIAAGGAPLADHANHYAHLLPYLLTPALAALDYSPAALTALLTALSAAALLLLYRAIAITAAGNLAGLALYAPVLGLALVPIIDDAGGLVFNANVFSVLPERLLGPCAVAWLSARHLRRPSATRASLVFFGAGLAAWNNPEFGLPCLLGAVAGCVLGSWDRGATLRIARRVAGAAAVGLGAATMIVCAVTLVAAGSLPDLDQLLYFSRLSGLQGFVLLPMPVLGIWIAVYLTFAGAVVLAAVRAASREPDRCLTGMLAFAGITGLAAGAFYVGRSDKFTMTALFPLWGLALALLAWWVVRERIVAGADSGWRLASRAGPLGLAVLVGLGLGASTLIAPPAPWHEIDRLASDSSGFDVFALDEEKRFVAERTHADEPVLLLRENSDLIAWEVGVRNVSPVSEPFHIIAAEHLELALEALARSGGESIFTGDGSLLLGLHPEIPEFLRERGWRPVARSATGRLTQWRRGGDPAAR